MKYDMNDITCMKYMKYDMYYINLFTYMTYMKNMLIW